MPPRLAPTGRSSSRSSKRSEPAPSPTGAVVAVGEIVGAHALRGWLRLRAYQPPAPSLVPGRRVWIAQAGACREVVGFRVETTGGESLGAVAETFPTGLNDVWVVRGGGREHLIPVVADVVRAIDRATRRIVIEPLPGLLD